LSDFTKAENSSVFTRVENLSGFPKGENLSVLPKAEDLSIFLKAEGVSDFQVWDIGQVTVSNFDWLPFTPPLVAFSGPSHMHGFSGKTKDNRNARQNLAELCNRPSLELKINGAKPLASFCLKPQHRKEVMR
jgi:hypothetical protein